MVNHEIYRTSQRRTSTRKARTIVAISHSPPMRKALFPLLAALSLILSAKTTQAQDFRPSRTQLEWDGWDVKITRLYLTNSIPQGSGDPKTADSDSTYVYLHMTVTNLTHKGQSFVPETCLKVTVGDDVFDADDIDLNMDYTHNIEPTLSKHRECYFELPKAAVKDSLVIRFQDLLTKVDVPVSITPLTDEEMRIQHNGALANASTPTPTIRANINSLSDQQALIAFNAIQDKYHLPHVTGVHYDNITDSYNWIGPTTGLGMSLPRAEFESEMRD